MLAILFMKLFKKQYFLNVDGECFIEGKSLESKIKRFFLRGAYAYLVAGETTATNVKKYTKCNKIYTYYFSSLSKLEIEKNNKNINKNNNDCILIVGQYINCKGLDIMLRVANKTPNLKYRFIGMGDKSKIFEKEAKKININNNIEIIPFLDKKNLYEEYQNCRIFVVPSRKECWGLVINEAASFGTPIVSTTGSGAAMELIEDKYPQFIAKAGDIEDLYRKIKELINYKDIDKYKKYLVDKSKKYNIETMVKKHIEAFEKAKEK